jgi:Tfp pilus assembly protein PilV
MRKDGGFSLAEVLVSIFLITVGLLALGHTLSRAITANYRTRQETQAIAYAPQKMELLKTLPFTHSDLSNGSHSDAPAVGFSRSWTVTTSGGQKTITLILTRSVPNQTQPVRVVLTAERAQ